MGNKNFIYYSPRGHLIGMILGIFLGIVLYIALGSVGTIGISILLLWIVHNYKQERYENKYLLYDIVNKKDISYIQTKRNLRKGEIICCTRYGDWYIEEVNVCFKSMYAYDEVDVGTITHEEDETFCLLKCRRIYDLVPEELLKEEQIEQLSEE